MEITYVNKTRTTPSLDTQTLKFIPSRKQTLKKNKVRRKTTSLKRFYVISQVYFKFKIYFIFY